MKFWRIWKGWLKLQISAEMAYRFNFLMKMFALFTFDSFGPLLALVVYSVSSGIPGWSFAEFLLMQGAFTLTTGINHFMFVGFAGRVIENVREGNYDIELVRPGKPLLMTMATATDMDGAPRIFTGSAICIYALIKLGWVFSLPNLLAFLILVAAAVMFLLSMQVIVGAMAFIYVRTYTLFNVFDVFTDIGKNPLTVFGPLGTFVMTFIFPIGLAAFYPASALLGRISPLNVAAIFGMGVLFFALSAGLWEFGIKKYTSAGG